MGADRNPCRHAPERPGRHHRDDFRHTGCNNLGQPTLLVFQGGYPSRGTVGALEVPNLTSNTDGTFSGTFVIPTDLHSLQGQGGGPVVPGTYEFVSRPVICMTDFTVTAPALLPDGGGEPIPSTRDIAGQEMVLVGLLLAVLGGLAFRAVLPRNRP